jgi:hypothetical protein
MNRFVGKVIPWKKGFCNGFFGRDSYAEKVIEAIGSDWVVARQDDGLPVFAYFEPGWQQEEMENLLKEWTDETDESPT